MCPSQEHFLSQIIRQKLFSSVDTFGSAQQLNARKWILFLPEEEHHDIPLLLSNYLLRAAGEQVYYLGPHVPLNTLTNAVKTISPQCMLLFMTRAKPTADAQNYIDLLSAQFPDQQVYISGNKKLLSAVTLSNNIKILENLTDFEYVIKNTVTV